MSGYRHGRRIQREQQDIDINRGMTPDNDYEHLYDSDIEAGEWVQWDYFSQLVISGTGSVIMDAQDTIGNISYGVLSYAVTDATAQVEFPYPGDGIEFVKFTKTGAITSLKLV